MKRNHAAASKHPAEERSTPARQILKESEIHKAARELNEPILHTTDTRKEHRAASLIPVFDPDSEDE